MSMILIWLAGAMFTSGLINPSSEGGFFRKFSIILDWPYELGRFIRLGYLVKE